MGSLSGYTASLYLGPVSSGAADYHGAELTNVSVNVGHEPVEVSDLASVFKERVAGLLDWEVTGSKNYVTQRFLTRVQSAQTSILCRVFSSAHPPPASAVFTAYGFVTRGLATYPMGAATEEITVQGGSTTSVATSGATPVYVDIKAAW